MGSDASIACAWCDTAAVHQVHIRKQGSWNGSGLLPVRQQRHRDLMNALVGGESSDPDALFGTPQAASNPAGTPLNPQPPSSH